MVAKPQPKRVAAAAATKKKHTKAAKEGAATSKKPAATKKPAAPKKKAAPKSVVQAKVSKARAASKTSAGKKLKTTTPASPPAIIVPETPSAYAIDGPANPTAIVVLGPGASAGFDHPCMVDLSAALVAAAAPGTRLAVLRFQFPRCGFKAGRLMATFHGAVALAKAQRPTAAGNVFIGGRSMGGRYATHVADDVEARGVACFGYPFVPPGTPPKPPRTEHLPALRCPTIIVQGERDSFGGRIEVESAGGVLRKALASSSAIAPIAWVATADHSLVPRASGGTRASALAFAATAAWTHFAKHMRR